MIKMSRISLCQRIRLATSPLTLRRCHSEQDRSHQSRVMRRKRWTQECTAVRKDQLWAQTALINAVNPIVDRIMDDESVEGVVMTNKEGAPILTNVSLTSATNYGQPLSRFATMAQSSIKELDIFDEVLIVRLITKKKEVMLVPDSEFNVIVVQHARQKKKIKEKRQKLAK